MWMGQMSLYGRVTFTSVQRKGHLVYSVETYMEAASLCYKSISVTHISMTKLWRLVSKATQMYVLPMMKSVMEHSVFHPTHQLP